MTQPTLREDLRRWIANEAGKEVAARLFPLVESTLTDLGYNLDAPASEEKLQEVKAELRAADATPKLMQRAFEESKRATEDGQSMLAWVRSVQTKAGGQKLAEKALRWAQDQPGTEPVGGSPGSDEPPSPEQAFALLLAWEELGGSAGVAAFREALRVAKGHLPSN